MRLGASIESRPAEVETRKNIRTLRNRHSNRKKERKERCRSDTRREQHGFLHNAENSSKGRQRSQFGNQAAVLRLWKKAGENLQDADSRPRT